MQCAYKKLVTFHFLLSTVYWILDTTGNLLLIRPVVRLESISLGLLSLLNRKSCVPS